MNFNKESERKREKGGKYSVHIITLCMHMWLSGTCTIYIYFVLACAFSFSFFSGLIVYLEL